MQLEPRRIPLDPTERCADAVEFEARLNSLVIGQPQAVTEAASLLQNYFAGLNDPERPAGIMLMLGPTGTGKTRLVQSMAEIMFGNPHALFKIDCAEYQDSYQTRSRPF